MTATVIAVGAVSDAGGARAPDRCAPDGAKVLLANRHGDIYAQNGEVMACNREAIQRQLVGADGRPIRESLDISGRTYAYAIKACDEIDCETVIGTGAFNVFGHAALVTVPYPQSDLVGSNRHEVPRLRVSRNKALAWIVCRRPDAFGDPETRTSRECLGKRYMRYVYARRASYADNAERSLRVTRIASGRTIEPRYLSLSRSGRTVKWRQNGRLRVRTIGR